MWSSKKQRCTVSSTTEAEYISMCQASKDIVWATRWMDELNFSKSVKLPICLCGDNKGALDLIRNPEHHARTKHIDIQYHFIREVIEDGLAITQHGLTSEMIADIFTKPLTPVTFQKFRGEAWGSRGERRMSGSTSVENRSDDPGIRLKHAVSPRNKKLELVF